MGHPRSILNFLILLWTEKYMCYVNMTDRDLMGQIAVKLNDYRYPPQGGMCIAHVNRWIGQFELNDRRFVLEETDRLLGIGYFSESDYRRVAREGANKQVISSQADSLIKISRIWADFFPANTSNQPI